MNRPSNVSTAAADASIDTLALAHHLRDMAADLAAGAYRLPGDTPAAVVLHMLAAADCLRDASRAAAMALLPGELECSACTVPTTSSDGLCPFCRDYDPARHGVDSAPNAVEVTQ